MPRPVVLFAALCMLAGCVEAEAPGAAIEVENMRLVRQRNGTQVVSGVVRNSSDRTRSAQLAITLYGPENERIGEVNVPIDHLAAGDIKGFHWSLDVDVKGVRLRQIMTL